MTYEEWIEQYKPIQNIISDDASFDGMMFETDGDELAYVKDHDNHNIWTICDEGDKMFICADYHLVNRIGYFITEKPWSDETINIDLENN